MPNLSSSSKFIKVADAATASTNSVTGSVIDTQGYDGVVFLTSFGTAATNNTIKVQQGTATNLSDAADLAGSSVSSGASDEDVWVEVYRPQKRYIQPVVTRGTSSTLGDIWAILYNSSKQPVDNTETGTIAGTLVVSPDEAS